MTNKVARGQCAQNIATLRMRLKLREGEDGALDKRVLTRLR